MIRYTRFKRVPQGDNGDNDIPQDLVLQEGLKRKEGIELTDVKRARREVTDVDMIDDDRGSVDMIVDREGERVLPSRLIIEILSYLPLDTYCRLRCLSKHFNNGLSDSRVVRIRPKVMVCTDSSDQQWNGGLFGIEFGKGKLNHWFKFPQPAVGKIMEIIGICKGLVCAYVWNPQKPKPYSYMVFNPITSEAIRLPCVHFRDLTMFGFGEVGGKLKVKVGVFNWEEQAVLTLGFDKDWRVSRRWNDDPCISRDGIYHEGSLYWVGRRKAIILFRLGAEQFEEYQIPKIGEEEEVVSVAAFGSTICAVVRGNSQTTVYTMAGDHWEKTRVICTDVDLHTKILRFMQGQDERLVILDQKLGIVKNGRVKWCNTYSDSEVRIQGGYIIEPMFQTLQQLGIYFDAGDEAAGMSDEDDEYDLIW